MTQFSIQRGFGPDQAVTVAALYWQAFAGKLGTLMGPEAKAVPFFTRVLDPEFTISAVASDSTVIGVAGFKTAHGSMTGGGLRDLAQSYGWVGALWRAIPLSLLDRDLSADILLMDGICVAEVARGQGVGTALLKAIKAEAAQQNLTHVRLDVIDTNPKARVLYEREGFVAEKTEHIGLFRHLFGFNSSLAMLYSVTAKDFCRDAAN